MIIEAGLALEERTPYWAARTLVVWDLIRHAERVAGKSFTRERQEILAALQSRTSGRTALLTTVWAIGRNDPDLEFVDRLLDEPDDRKQLAYEQVAAVLAADQLVEVGLATWASGVLDGPYFRETPSWMKPSIARVRFEIESTCSRIASCWKTRTSRFGRPGAALPLY